MMNQQAISRGLLTATLLASALLASGCGGGGSGTTEGAQSSFASSNSAFDYKSAKSVPFSAVIDQMKSVVLPADLSATQAYVIIYLGTDDERVQLANLTVELYRSLIAGTSTTDNMGIFIPLDTTEVKYEIFGEDTSGNAVAASGSITL